MFRRALVKCAQHIFRADRQLAEAHADGVEDGIGDGRRRAVDRHFGNRLGAVRAQRLVGLAPGSW